jgi:MFS family permease
MMMSKPGLLHGLAALSKTEAYSIVFPTVLFSISQIVIHAILPQIIVELVCLEDTTAVHCGGPIISGKASLVNLISSFIINIPCVFLIGFYASFAKKYGLKPTLLAPVIGNLLFLVSILVARYSKSYFFCIMFGSLVSGLSGGRNCFMMATFAYAANVTSPQERSKVFSVIESSIYSAKILCPFTIGILSGQFGFGLSLIMGMGFSFLNTIWIIFAMKDPSPSQDIEDLKSPPSPTVDTVLLPYDDDDLANEFSIRKRDRQRLSFHPFATFHSVGKLWGRNSIGNSTVPVIAGVYFLYHMIAVGVHVVEILFVKYKFGWDPYLIGLFGSMNGIVEILSMLLAPVIATHLLGLALTDLNWIEMGLWARALFFCVIGFSTSSFQLFAVLPLLLFCGPVVPRVRSYLSKSVSPQQQNDLFAALAALDAISALLSPLFTAAYYRTVSFFPGCVFEIMFVLFVLAASAILFVRKGFGKDILDYLPISEAM